MKTKLEIRNRINDLITMAVNTASQVEEEEYLNRAKELGWVIGIQPHQIMEQWESEMDDMYGDKGVI